MFATKLISNITNMKYVITANKYPHISFIELLNSGRYSASGKWRLHARGYMSSYLFSTRLPESFSVMISVAIAH